MRRWWKEKAREIYELIPDFGGFLVKANSEGQPGPQDYGCSHADGAYMHADALEPYGGVNEVKVMQRLWKDVEGGIDDERFSEVEALLRFQEREAIWWRDACVRQYRN